MMNMLLAYWESPTDSKIKDNEQFRTNSAEEEFFYGVLHVSHIGGRAWKNKELG
jgi:hypothetical protein